MKKTTIDIQKVMAYLAKKLGDGHFIRDALFWHSMQCDMFFHMHYKDCDYVWDGYTPHEFAGIMLLAPWQPAHLDRLKIAMRKFPTFHDEIVKNCTKDPNLLTEGYSSYE